MKKVLFIGGAVLGAAAATAMYYAYRTCFYSPVNRFDDPHSPMEGKQYEPVQEYMHRITNLMEKAVFEPVQICSHDGLLLYGRYYHTADNAPLQILFHGYRSHPLRDCAGGFLLARKLGFNILVVDQRGHGKSGGKDITFGILERQDCLRWAHYALYRFGRNTPVILSGLSMGAATVLMASSLPLPENVVGIMADCPYDSPAGIIRKVCKDRRMPAKLASPIIHACAMTMGHFRLNAETASQAVRHAKVPILLIHGEDDRFVPCEMSRNIFKNCASPAQLHTFPGAGHGLSYMTDPLRYEAVITGFLKNIPVLQAHLHKNGA